ncbi:MAG: STY0301 family protein [Gammaproteobacteria bacterium]
MSRPIPLTLVVLTMAAAWPAAHVKAADLRATCPSTVPAEALVPGKLPKGWKGYVADPIRLDAAGMMAGPPESITYLKPDSATSTVQRWEIERGSERWFWCKYGPMRIALPMASEATRCTVTTKPVGRNKGDDVTATAECK